MADSKSARLLIIGSGPAGCTAAVYASRAGLDPVLLTGVERGGQLTTTTDVENWPADPPGVQGPDLMERFIEHAGRFGGKVVQTHVNRVDLEASPMRVEADDGVYLCESVIIASGASAKYLGLESEKEYLGKGVSACATCDGFFYRGLPVAVIGGGNTAAEEALYLSNIASKVTLVHRRDTLRAEDILQRRLRERVGESKVEFLYDHVLEEVLGDEAGVNGTRLKNVLSGEERRLEVSGVFIAIGHKPNTDLFEGQLDMDGGYIVTRRGDREGQTATSIEGVFAAGDVQDQIYRQAVTSAASGCMAALDAERYLAGR